MYFPRFAAVMLLLSIGCGELADADSHPPELASLRGTLRLSSTTTAPQGDVRVALVWKKWPASSPAVDCARTSQEMESENSDPLLLNSAQQAVDITPVFPSAFEIELTQPPPPETMYPRGDGVRLAEGVLVVYLDGNRNGVLDARSDDSPSPDQLLASTVGVYSEQPQTWFPSYEIFYADRDSAPSEWRALHAGYNVSGGSSAASELELVLRPSLLLQHQLCTNECTVTHLDQSARPENPAAELPTPPANAQVLYFGTVKVWVWEEGTNSYVIDERYCRRSQQPGGGYTFSWFRTYFDGCSQRRLVHFNYGPAPEPSPNWPCESYKDVD